MQSIFLSVSLTLCVYPSICLSVICMYLSFYPSVCLFIKTYKSLLVAINIKFGMKVSVCFTQLNFISNFDINNLWLLASFSIYSYKYNTSFIFKQLHKIWKDINFFSGFCCHSTLRAVYRPSVDSINCRFASLIDWWITQAEIVETEQGKWERQSKNLFCFYPD